MIAISFVMGKISEENAAAILQQVGDHTITQINKIQPKAILTGTPWVYRRVSQEPGEPSISLITDVLEHYLWLSAKAVDRPKHETWIFDIQCPNHAIALPNSTQPQFHILKPDQVSQLFYNLAKGISTIIDVEVGYFDDHTKRGVKFLHGKITEKEHWEAKK